jgi:hypothetical protein
MQRTLLMFILIIGASQVKAQYGNQTLNNDSTIATRRYRRHDYYRMNNQDLEKDYLLYRLTKFPSSADELSRSKIHLGMSVFFLTTFVAAYVVPNPTSLIFSVIGIPSCIIESIIARKHFRKSIHLYNIEMSKHQTT